MFISRLKKITTFLYCLLVVFFVCLFSCLGSDWDWVKEYKSDSNLTANLDGVEVPENSSTTVPTIVPPEKSAYTEFEKTYVKEFKDDEVCPKDILEDQIFSESSATKSGTSAKYSLNPSNINFYKLKVQGYDIVLDIWRGIITGTNNWCALINVISDNSARIYLAEFGTFGILYRSQSVPHCWFFGCIQKDSFNSPNFYCFTYYKSSDSFTDFQNGMLQGNSGSVGWLHNIYDFPVDFYSAYSFFKQTYSDANDRDIYYFGRQHKGKFYSIDNPNAVTMNLLCQSGASYPFIRVYPNYWNLQRGFCSSLLDTSLVNNHYYFCNTNYSLQPLWDNTIVPAEPEPTYNETYTQNTQGINEAVSSFNGKTQSFNNLMSNNLNSISASISNYFNNFNALLPTSIVIIVVLLLILIVAIGILK